MKREYLLKQIDAALVEAGLAFEKAAIESLVVVGSDFDAQESDVRLKVIEIAFTAYKNIFHEVFDDALGFTDSSDEDWILKISEKFHLVLREELSFTSVPLEDGGEQE